MMDLGPHKIRLSWNEAHVAAIAGVNRHMTSLYNARNDQHGARDSWDLHVQGALGEMVVAKWLGVYWDAAVNTFKRPDLGARVQVRCRSRHDYELIVRRDDADQQLFVLVTGQPPTFFVRGFMLGVDAKRDEWLKDHGRREKAFFVPHAALRSPDDLRRELA